MRRLPLDLCVCVPPAHADSNAGNTDVLAALDFGALATPCPTPGSTSTPVGRVATPAPRAPHRVPRLTRRAPPPGGAGFGPVVFAGLASNATDAAGISQRDAAFHAGMALPCAVAVPCAVTLVLSNVVTTHANRLKKPAHVTSCVECCCQKRGIACVSATAGRVCPHRGVLPRRVTGPGGARPRCGSPSSKLLRPRTR